MSNDTYYTLQDIRIEGIPEGFRDRALYVEVELNNVVRKTGTLDNEGKPAWNDTLTFSQAHDNAESFLIRLKRPPRTIGYINIDAKVLLEGSTRSHKNVQRDLIPKRILPFKWKRSESGGRIMLALSSVDALTQAKIELNAAEQSIKRLNALVQRSDTASEMIGAFVDVADVVIEIVDNVAQIHPIFNLTWQITSSLYKVASQRLATDSHLVDLVEKMQKAYEFYTKAEGLNDRTELLKPTVKALVKETTVCSRFVQKYTARRFLARMFYILDQKKVEEHSAQFDTLRKELDSIISLHAAQMAETIYEQQQRDAQVRLEAKVEVIDIKSQQQLDKLRKVLDPFQFSPDVSNRPRCLEETREEYLLKITTFLSATESTPNILWLSGPAGSGKSTIAVTASDRCAESGYRPVHLFFEREKSKSTLIIRTIAYQLAYHYPPVALHIVKAVDRNKNITDSTLRKQFKELILDPLRAVADAVVGPIVVILDALDESGSFAERQHFLSLFKTDFAQLPPKVRFLVTSRPEHDIEECLATGNHVERLTLTDKPDINKHDVSLYIMKEMEEFKDKDWDENIKILCGAAEGLFIWASTVVKMVKNTSASSFERKRMFAGLMGDVRSVGGGIDKLYETALKESRIWRNDSTQKEEGVSVLGFILVSKEAIPVRSIAAFLGLEEGAVDSVLSLLRSVISYEPGKPVRLHHASFADYLLSSKRSGCKPWHIDKGKQKHAITERCFVVMARDLCFNICDIESSFLPNSEIPGLQERIEGKIPSHLDYACRFWSAHMCELERPGSDLQNTIRNKLYIFAKTHLLYWLEVLSLTGRFIRIAGRALNDASSWVDPADAELSSFLSSAYKLVSVFAYPISQSVPHLYLSAISLWKGEARVANHYSKTHPVVEVRRLGTRSTTKCLRVLKGDGGYVRSVAISPDGRLIASISIDKMVRVWDADSGEFISSNFEMDGLGAVVFSPDSVHIVSCSRKGTVCTWDVNNGKRVSEAEVRTKHGDSDGAPGNGNSDEEPRGGDCEEGDEESEDGDDFEESEDDDMDDDVRAVQIAFVPDGKRVVSICGGKVYVFDFDDGKLELVPEWFDDGTDVKFCAVSANGKYVVGARDKTICVWDSGTGKQRSTPFEADDCWWSTAVSHDGKRVATGDDDGRIDIWNTDNGDLVSSLDEIEYVMSLAFSSDSKRIVAGSFSGDIAIWNADNGDLVWGPIQGHTDWVTSVIFTPDGKRVISGSDHGEIRIWDVDNAQVDSGSFDAHTYLVSSVAFSPDGKRVVSGSWDNTVRLWDADSGKLLAGPFEGHANSVTSVAFSPDGKRVVSGSTDNTIRIWDVDSGKLALGPLRGHRDSVESVAFSTDGNRIVSGSRDETICIWDADNRALVKGPLKAHTSRVESVSFSPDNTRIVSGSQDATICIWDADTGELIMGPLKGHASSVNSVMFSPDGKRIASGSRDKTIRIWDADSGEFVSQFEGHTSCVYSISYSPDGKLIASGSQDETVRVWDADTGELVLGPLGGHTGGVDSVSFSPIGNRVVSGSRDGTIRVWDVSIDRLVPGEGGERTKGALTTSSSSHRVDTDAISHGQSNNHNRSGAHMFSNWKLHNDGWIKGEGGELLTWIPEDMRGTLWRARNTAVFSCKFSARLDFLSSRVGENWAEGYPKPSSVLTVPTL